MGDGFNGVINVKSETEMTHSSECTTAFIGLGGNILLIPSIDHYSLYCVKVINPGVRVRQDNCSVHLDQRLSILPVVKDVQF